MRIDLQRSVSSLDERIADEPYPRHRAIIEQTKDHIHRDAVGDLDRILATLIDEHVHHSSTSDSLVSDLLR